jgi:hypothetical protein
MRVFEKRVLREIFGPTTEEVKEGRRSVDREEVHNL